MLEGDFLWLQTWYYAHCNGDWEHDKRIHIGTIDNPGWSLTINIESTELQDGKFEQIEVERSDDDWFICFVKDNKFEGVGGPLNLSEIVQIFRKWTEKNQEGLDERGCV